MHYINDENANKEDKNGNIDEKNVELVQFDDDTNPFKVRWQFSAVDWIQMSVIAVTLAPLRLLVLFLTIIIAWMIASIGKF